MRKYALAAALSRVADFAPLCQEYGSNAILLCLVCASPLLVTPFGHYTNNLRIVTHQPGLASRIVCSLEAGRRWSPAARMSDLCLGSRTAAQAHDRPLS